MRVLVAGSHGLIGRPLVAALAAGGHDVRRLVRGTPAAPGEIAWDPAAGRLDPAAIDGENGVDAVINLAGAGIGDRRWTDAYKQTILRSRVDSTALLARTLAGLARRPAVLVQASAIGVYGDRGEEHLDETSAPGAGFLVDVVRAWEQAAAPAADAGVRVAFARTGLVLTGSGGAAGRMLPLVRLGLGGPLGTGRQWWSWISLADEVAALTHLLEAPVAGPVNLTAPEPVRNRDAVRAIAAALHRRAPVPVPAFALRIVLGEFAQDVLGSQRVAPGVLSASGFTFRHPTIGDAAAAVAAGG